jgi:hypothetical protein
VRSLTLQQLLLLAVIVLVPLLNLLLRWLQRRMEAAAPASPGPEAAGPLPGLPPRAERREPLPAVELPRVAARARRRPRPTAPIGTLPEIRRAVVMMTVLGPCRALEEPPPAGTARRRTGSPPPRHP